MKTRIIHIIALTLLLITSMNFVMHNFAREMSTDTVNLEQNDSEKELDDVDLDKKETVTNHKLQFSNKLTALITHHIVTSFRTLEHFEQITTPPPEA